MGGKGRGLRMTTGCGYELSLSLGDGSCLLVGGHPLLKLNPQQLMVPLGSGQHGFQLTHLLTHLCLVLELLHPGGRTRDQAGGVLPTHQSWLDYRCCSPDLLQLGEVLSPCLVQQVPQLLHTRLQLSVLCRRDTADITPCERREEEEQNLAGPRKTVSVG